MKSILHEIMHAAGFCTQSRDDRKRHITIQWKNINEKRSITSRCEPCRWESILVVTKTLARRLVGRCKLNYALFVLGVF